MIEPITAVQPAYLYWERREAEIAAKERRAIVPRTIPVAKDPYIVYNKNGELIETPDQSWNLGSKYV
jgi:hypothetical protein